MKIIKRLFITVFTLLILSVFLFNGYTFFCIKVLKQDLATFSGYALLEVVTGSMEPTIHIGDMIIIDTKVQEYQENDIVTFYDVNGAFVTHRILSINDGEMVTKGDNNNAQDAPISTKNIVGKYVKKLDGMGKILSSFKSPFVMVMILIIGFMVCFLISTDKDGKPILTEEEKEFQDYLKNGKKLNDEKVINEKKTSVKKENVKNDKDLKNKNINSEKKKVVQKNHSSKNGKIKKKSNKKKGKKKKRSR